MWVTSLFLLEDPQLSKIVNEINPYLFSLDDRLIFKYYVAKVPQKRRYLKFTKKDKKTEAIEEQVKHLMETEGVSRREALLSLGKG